MNDIEISASRGALPDHTALWARIRSEALEISAREVGLRGFLETSVFQNDGFAEALVKLLARKLGDVFMSADRLGALARGAFADDPAILVAAASDLAAITTRDPAAQNISTPFLYYKGFHALEWHRVGNFLWRQGRREIAHFLQSRVSEVFAVDIHPAVPFGTGVFIDHGTGLVVGETSVIGNDVSILQEVTLGGTGKERGDRHPKVRDGVLLSAGAKVLGNIEIGRNAKVGAGSVVLTDVPPCATVAGVPARIVGWCRETTPAHAMDQSLPERAADRISSEG
jgi:serine O-acetyltransferase